MTVRHEVNEDKELVALYVDGSYAPTTNADLLDLGFHPKLRDHFEIGYSAPDFPETKQYFEGQIDEVQLFGRALSSDEIVQALSGCGREPLTL